MSGPVFNPDAYKDALVGGLSTYTKRDWLGASTNDGAISRRELITDARAANTAIVEVRPIMNGYLVVCGECEIYAADLTDVGQKTISLLAAKTMEKR